MYTGLHTEEGGALGVYAWQQRTYSVTCTKLVIREIPPPPSPEKILYVTLVYRGHTLYLKVSMHEPSFIPRPLPRFQCYMQNIENVGLAWGQG